MIALSKRSLVDPIDILDAFLFRKLFFDLDTADPKDQRGDHHSREDQAMYEANPP